MIYFISNFNMTLLWNRIIKGLNYSEKNAKHLFTSAFLEHYLKELAPNEELQDFITLKEITQIKDVKSEIDSLLQQINQSFDTYLDNDRYLSTLNKSEASNILIKAYLSILDFIASNQDIKFIVGEVTNHHEVLLYTISIKFKNFKYLYIHNNRLYPNQLSFFNYDFSIDKEMSYLFDGEDKILHNSDFLEYGKEILKNKINNPKRISKLFFMKYKKYINSHDIQYMIFGEFKLIKIVKNRIKKILDFILIKLILQVFSPKIITTRCSNYIFYPLHVVPEATVNIVAPTKINQVDNIFKLSKIYPNMKIIFKPHPNGDSLRWYDYINLLKNKKIFISFITSEELILNSKIVYTISGTAGLEAIKLNKEVYVDSNIFFSKHPLNLKNKYDGDNFENYIFQYTFPGFYQDPILYANVLEEKNIENYINIFKRVLND